MTRGTVVRLVIVLALVVVSASCQGDGDRRPPTGEGGSATSADLTDGSRAGADSAKADHAGTESYGDRGSFYLKAADQRSDGHSVVIDEAVLTGPGGWIAIHAHVVELGAIGPIIGVSHRLSAGTSRNVRVTLGEPIGAQLATVYPMLHVDTDGNDRFDFPDGDGPATLPGGGVVLVGVRLRVN